MRQRYHAPPRPPNVAAIGDQASQHGNADRAAQSSEPCCGHQVEQCAADNRIGRLCPITTRKQTRVQIVQRDLHAPKPAWRRHIQCVTNCCRGKSSRSGPRCGAPERLIQQEAISIQQQPILAASDDRREETKQASRATTQIHNAWPSREQFGKALRELQRTRGMVERLA